MSHCDGGGVLFLWEVLLFKVIRPARGDGRGAEWAVKKCTRADGNLMATGAQIAIGAALAFIGRMDADQGRICPHLVPRND